MGSRFIPTRQISRGTPRIRGNGARATMRSLPIRRKSAAMKPGQSAQEKTRRPPWETSASAVMSQRRRH